MRINPMPYFMTNSEWFFYDKRKRKYILTKKAPVEAIESYRLLHELLKRKHTLNGYIKSSTEQRKFEVKMERMLKEKSKQKEKQ